MRASVGPTRLAIPDSHCFLEARARRPRGPASLAPQRGRQRKSPADVWHRTGAEVGVAHGNQEPWLRTRQRGGGGECGCSLLKVVACQGLTLPGMRLPHTAQQLDSLVRALIALCDGRQSMTLLGYDRHTEVSSLTVDETTRIGTVLGLNRGFLDRQRSAK